MISKDMQNKCFQNYIENNIRNYNNNMNPKFYIWILSQIFQVNIRVVDSRLKLNIKSLQYFFGIGPNFESSKLFIPLIKDKEIVIYQDNEYYEPAAKFDDVNEKNSYKLEEYESTFLIKIDYVKQYQLLSKAFNNINLTHKHPEFKQNINLPSQDIQSRKEISNNDKNQDNSKNQDDDQKKVIPVNEDIKCPNDSKNKVNNQKEDNLNRNESNYEKKGKKDNPNSDFSKIIQSMTKIHDSICSCILEKHHKEKYFKENIIFNDAFLIYMSKYYHEF